MVTVLEAGEDYGLSDLVAHAAASIEAADVFSAPFPHIFFRDFFPAGFYRQLLDNLPDHAVFDQLNKERTRFLARLYDGHIERVDPDPRGPWRKVSAVLQSSEVERAIRHKLAEGLEIRRKGEKLASADDLALFAKPVLYEDLDGYRIRPHPDTRKKVVTMQLYMPRDDSQKDLGTTLYRMSVKGMFRIGSWLLEPAKTFPFLPNVGYAFVVLKPYHSVSKTSWHGRPEISTAQGQPRLSILNTFYCEETLGV
ncbi:MAG: hypothetical protein WAU86_22705 [Oricola sp.]